MANEKRLIDANGSYTINANDNTGYSLCFVGGTISVFDDFGRCLCECDTEDAPTVDAVEVVHGWWEYNRGAAPYEKSYYCSVCIGGESDYGNDNYCPNCGARMDGDGNG